jgi:hypothetical protein
MRVLLAASDVPDEPLLVQAAVGAGLEIVRRCVDAVDLLAAAQLDPTIAIVVSPGLPRLKGEIVEGCSPRRFIGLVALPQDVHAVQAFGITEWVSRLGSPEETMLAVAELLAGHPAHAMEDGGVWRAKAWAESQHDPTPAQEGRVIAVVSAAGAPGRSQTSLRLARGYGRAGTRTLLIDADQRAPSLAQVAEVIDDISGVAFAARHLENGTLSPQVLRGVSAQLESRVDVISGLLDVFPYPLHIIRQMMEVAVQTYGTVIVDAGQCEVPCLPTPILDRSDAVVVVFRDDPLSIGRTVHLVGSWQYTEGSTLLAVTGDVRRRRLSEIGRVLSDHGVHAPLVSASRVTHFMKVISANTRGRVTSGGGEHDDAVADL